MILSLLERSLVPIILSLTSILLAWYWNRRVEKKVEGQREERIKRAHEDIITLVMRNAIQNKIPIQDIVLDYITGSILRKYQISNEEFFSKRELFEDIYTRIMDNEYILSDAKNDLKKEIKGIIERPEIFFPNF